MKDHGTVLMIAWGMGDMKNGHLVGISENDWRALRATINDELRPYKLILKSAGRPNCVLTKRKERHARKTGFNQYKQRQLCLGSLQACCRCALTVIDPENYPVEHLVN